MVGNSNWTGYGRALPPPLCPHFPPLPPLVHTATGTQAVLLFLEHIQYTPTPGPLHLQCPLFLLSGIYSAPTHPHDLFLYSFMSLLKVPFSAWPCLTAFLQLQTPSILDSSIPFKYLTWCQSTHHNATCSAFTYLFCLLSSCPTQVQAPEGSNLVFFPAEPSLCSST